MREMKRFVLCLFVLAVALAATSAFGYTPPRTSDILFSVNTDSFPASGPTGNWASYYPTGLTYNQMGNPNVDVINGVKWEKQTYGSNQGYTIWGAQTGTYTVNLPVPSDGLADQGATAIAVIKPTRSADTGNWRSIVDVMYDQFVLGIANNNGQICVRRATNTTGGTATFWSGSSITIPDGQTTVLSCVVKADGTFKVYANGTLIWTSTTTATFTAWGKSGLNATAIGRNNYDGWTVFNGNMGDIFCYTVALKDADRQALENDLMAKFHAGAAYPAKTINASASAGATITPSGAQTVQYEADKTFTIAAQYGYSVDVVVDGISQGNIPSYTFNDVIDNHTIVVNTAALTKRTISGNVSAKVGGGATVSIRATSGALAAQSTTTDASGHYSMLVPEGTYYVCASQTGYVASAEQTTNATGDQTIDFTLTAGRNIPAMETLLFAADTNAFTGAIGANTGDWPLLYCTMPGITKLTMISTPVLEKVRGIKYDFNFRPDGDGYRLNTASVMSAIPTNGASVVAVVKPKRNTTSDGFNSVVDIFYGNLILGVKNNTGQIQVRRNGTDYWSANDANGTLADGQLAILSLVVQPDGTFKVWCSKWNSTTNTFGAASTILTSTVASAFTAFVPAQASPDDYRRWINVGRNNPDGWTTFNGHIGDVFVYKTALSDADRAALEADINFKTTNITTYNITATAGANGSISPAGVTAVGETDSQTYTITPNWGYNVSDVLVDGVSQGAITTYTFTNVIAPHTISVSFAAKPTYAVSGKVTDGTNGIAGATVYVSTTANASVAPTQTVTTDAGGNYSFNLFDGTWYVCASASGFTTSADTTVTVAGAAVVNPNIVLVASGKHIPQMDKLIFSLYGQSLTVNGATTAPWPLEFPIGKTAEVMGQPQVTTVDGVQWEQNRYASADGYRVANYTAPIPVNGITATAVVQPQGDGVNGGNWTSIIDVMYNRFILGIRGANGANPTLDPMGELIVLRNGNRFEGPVIPNGQKTVLTAVVQPDGQFKVFANGIQVMDEKSTSAMTALDPTWNAGGVGFWSYINVGRNNPDGWTTYNGNIGAAMLWKTSLSQAERIAFEQELGTTFGITMPVYHNITATAGVGGTIDPAGVVPVMDGTSQTFNITANVGYKISNVVVDGVSQGAISSVTFDAVTAPHTVAVSFAVVPQHTISGKVTVKKAGTPIAGATVSIATSPNASNSPVYTATTDASGNWSKLVYDGAYYVCAGAAGYYTSADSAITVAANATGINFALASTTRNIPRPTDVLLGAVTDSLPSSGAITAWPTYLPAGGSLTAMGAPEVELIDGMKWEKNTAVLYNTDGTIASWPATGFRFGDMLSSPIAINGATACAIVRPVRNTTSTGWTSVIDVMYSRFRVGVNNATGQVIACRQGTMVNSGAYVIPEGQKTILTLVAQPTGEFKVFANGAMIIENATTSDLTAFDPTVSSWGATGTGYWSFINVGRNNPDGWTAFNGNIGDNFLYKVALTDAERRQLENDIASKFGILKTVSGRVVNSAGEPVQGAEILILKDGVATNTGVLTDATGHYTIDQVIVAGDYQVSAYKHNYVDPVPVNLTVTDTVDSYTVADIVMDALTTFNISGVVTDALTGQPAANVKLVISSVLIATPYTVTTDANGAYSVDVLQYADYTIDVDPAQSPSVILLTPLADRYTDLLYDNWVVNLSVKFNSSVSGKVVATDPSGFAITVKDSTGAVAGTATTGADGTFKITVLPGDNYTVTVKKAGYVTSPASQTVNVAAGATDYPVADFTASASTIHGVLKDAITGQPIANGVVQSGSGPGSAAVVTDATGAFSLPGTGAGGIELFGDALGYHCRNYVVNGSGDLKKDILLVPENETGVIVNGGFENVVDGLPTAWGEKWVAGGLQFAASTDAASGSYSCWYTGTASYSALAQYVPVQPGSLYTAYFKAKADAEVTQWFPMISFRGDWTDPDTGEVTADQELRGWISGEPGKDGWVHTPPYAWYQYLKFHTYAGNPTQPFVRIAPVTGAQNIAVSFCYADLPPAGKGCYVDDVVIDRVAADEPVVFVDPDPTIVDKPVGANNKSILTDAKLIGKYVRVWGKIISKSSGSYTIDDGYGIGVNIKGTTTQTDMVVVDGYLKKLADGSLQIQP